MDDLVLATGNIGRRGTRMSLSKSEQKRSRQTRAARGGQRQSGGEED
jgi:hypothetical protein